MHEASRRILSTLLRKIDSFESTTDVLLIAATNRKQDLDAAMLSRIDLSIKFELPDELSRVWIFTIFIFIFFNRLPYSKDMLNN